MTPVALGRDLYDGRAGIAYRAFAWGVGIGAIGGAIAGTFFASIAGTIAGAIAGSGVAVGPTLVGAALLVRAAPPGTTSADLARRVPGCLAIVAACTVVVGMLVARLISQEFSPEDGRSVVWGVVASLALLVPANARFSRSTAAPGGSDDPVGTGVVVSAVALTAWMGLVAAFLAGLDSVSFPVMG